MVSVCWISEGSSISCVSLVDFFICLDKIVGKVFGELLILIFVVKFEFKRLSDIAYFEEVESIEQRVCVSVVLKSLLMF